jgi:Carboxypeptidase regulatory-like domain/TonB dependent receptor
MNRDLRTALVLAIVACASFFLCAPASAQSVYGSIFGTVTDASGAAVPGATITVKDTAKGTIVTATSNASGDYSVPHLIPDTYDLKVEAKGFKAFEASGVPVLADTAPRIDPTLTVGSESTTVQVNADAVPELKTDRADVSTVFDRQQVSSLPIADQNFTNLQLLLPGAQKLGWSHAADENPQGSQQIQVNGQAFGGTAFELDGADNQDPILGIIVINPALDAVTETKITTQNYDAELGKAVSAVVTAQTRSGTNKFHGSAYDYRTGNANIARDPYTQPPGYITRAAGLPSSVPPGLKNRFGGSIGGPVLKDRLFFFGNYEGQRQKVGVSNTDTVPTAQMVSTCLGPANGGSIGPMGIPGCDFSDYAATYQSAGKLSVPQLIYDNLANPSPDDLEAFSKNVIPMHLISPQTQNLLKIMQPFAPNRGSSGIASIENNYAGSGTGLFNSDSWVVRGDYTLSQTMHAFGRFSRFTDTLTGGVMFGEAGGPGFGLGAPPYGGNSNGANDSAAGGMDIAINPKLLTDFRLGYYRYNVIDTKYDQGVDFATQLGIPGINLGDFFTSGAPGFQADSPFGSSNNGLIGGGLSINRCNCPLTEREDQYQIVNNWTRVMGNHTLKVGADLRYARNLRVPSDTDRAGLMEFTTGPTSTNNGSNGLGWATLAMGLVPKYGRYVGNTALGEQNAKEFQKRTFFYAQDTWRVTHALTLNLGLRYEIYWPEVVNAAEHGSLLNIKDGYMHVAGVGGIATNMGWGISWGKMFDPRIGVAYQLNDKTVIRAGYGRSFDTGVFGSIFGHVATQNLPILASQSADEPGGSVGCEFNLGPGSPDCFDHPGQQGPVPYVFPTVPSNGLLPAQNYSSQSKARPNPLNFPTIDAWNVAFQRAVTAHTSFTLAYVGTKGTHTLGDTDQNNTFPNEATLFLPGQYSVTGQTLNWDPNGLGKVLPSGYSGGVNNSNYLSRYYGGKLPACNDPNYIGVDQLLTQFGELNLQPGMCGWTQAVNYYGNDQNTEYDALQITVNETGWKGLVATANYQWASAFGDQNTYWTWNHVVTHLRDSNVRRQQLTFYGSYDIPVGRGKQYFQNVNRAMDLLIGGWQLSDVLNWSGGLPFGVNFSNFGGNQDCNHNVGGTAAPCRPNAAGPLQKSLTSFTPNSGGTGSRNYWNPQPKTGGLFSYPGLDVIGNGGANNYSGPSFFSSDMAITKAFTIWESVVAKFRMDAFNVFNHINAGNPSNNDIFGTGIIQGEAAGCVPNGNCGPRQLEFSLHLQF